jgi:hypothetical protein
MMSCLKNKSLSADQENMANALMLDCCCFRLKLPMEVVGKIQMYFMDRQGSRESVPPSSWNSFRPSAMRLAVELEEILRDISQRSSALAMASKEEKVSPDMETVVASFKGNKERLQVFRDYGAAWFNIDILPKKAEIQPLLPSIATLCSLGVFQTSQQVLNQIHRIQTFIQSYSVNMFEIYHCREKGLHSIYRCADLEKGCFIFDIYFVQNMATTKESNCRNCELFIVIKYQQV